MIQEYLSLLNGQPGNIVSVKGLLKRAAIEDVELFYRQAGSRQETIYRLLPNKEGWRFFEVSTKPDGSISQVRLMNEADVGLTWAEVDDDGFNGPVVHDDHEYLWSDYGILTCQVFDNDGLREEGENQVITLETEEGSMAMAFANWGTGNGAYVGPIVPEEDAKIMLQVAPIE